MIESALVFIAGIFIGRTYPAVWDHLHTAALRLRDWWRARP